MPTDLFKTFTYLSIHLTVGFTVAYLMTGSLQIAGGIALIEPCINAVAFFFHEKAWKKALSRTDKRAERHATSAQPPVWQGTMRLANCP